MHDSYVKMKAYMPVRLKWSTAYIGEIIHLSFHMLCRVDTSTKVMLGGPCMLYIKLQFFHSIHITCFLIKVSQLLEVMP